MIEIVGARKNRKERDAVVKSYVYLNKKTFKNKHIDKKPSVNKIIWQNS